ncbi:hypothetical protein IWQ60_008865 [Tieghemiomyces parasiticus]|uniref:Uncharacterized protein n=1 Tax=Tieghemiomyces parasiticus TaxID=78921 RepID=A0A9W7ZYE6_9FUNG|nr:hypothetical protein IWQ60_008865 [Tieghemiomyces parasiticus]
MAEPKEATVHPDDFIYKIPGSFPESALVDDDKVLEGQDESHSRNSFLANWFGKLTRSSWSTKPKTSLSETHEGSGSNHSDSEAAKPTLEKENSATLGYPGTPEEAGEKIKSDIDELFKSHPIPPTIEEKAREMIARRKKEDEDRLAQFETANSDRDDRPTQENTDRSPLESSSSPIVPFHGSLQGYNADGTARTTTSAPHLEAEANVMDELAKFNYLIRIDPTGSAATPNPISGQGEDEIATTTPQATGEYYPNLEKLIKDGIITIQEGDNHPLGPIFDTNARMYPQEPEKHVLAINLSRSDELRQIAPFLSIENGELVFDLYKLHDMVRKNIFRAKVYDGQSTMDRPYSPDNMCDDQSSCGVDEENTTRA